MSRQIKFRAWDKLRKQMKYGVECGVDLGIWVDFGSVLHSDDFEVMQFTGLLDKNGKEIYEGDIINGACFNGSYAYGRVVWSNDAAFLVYSIGKFIEGCNDLYYDVKHFEVIGNEWENPELLQK